MLMQFFFLVLFFSSLSFFSNNKKGILIFIYVIIDTYIFTIINLCKCIDKLVIGRNNYKEKFLKAVLVL